MVGLCHTDITMRDNGWGVTDYPIVLGHEGIGKVRRVGSSVSHAKVGDRVAIAWIRNSCQACDACLDGRENICREGFQGTYLGKSAGLWGSSPLKYNEHGGCFSRIQRIEEKFAVKIPDNLPSEIACPLMCGGGTVYEPIVDWAKPNSKVGISSLGGLGTVGVKLARLRGCTVYALSGTPGKRDMALAAGAHHFIDMTDKDAVEKAKGTLDVLVDTAPVMSSVADSMELLKYNGAYCRVGVPVSADAKFEYDMKMLIFTARKISGSVVTGSKRLHDMLDLCSNNLDFMEGDSPEGQTQDMPMAKVNEAMEMLENKTNKGYRIILKW